MAENQIFFGKAILLSQASILYYFWKKKYQEHRCCNFLFWMRCEILSHSLLEMSLLHIQTNFKTKSRTYETQQYGNKRCWKVHKTIILFKVWYTQKAPTAKNANNLKIYIWIHWAEIKHHFRENVTKSGG